MALKVLSAKATSKTRELRTLKLHMKCRKLLSS